MFDSITNLPSSPPQLSVFSLDDLQISAEITWQEFYDLYNGTLQRNITAQGEYYNTVFQISFQNKRFGKENQKLISHLPYPYSQLLKTGALDNAIREFHWLSHHGL